MKNSVSSATRGSPRPSNSASRAATGPRTSPATEQLLAMLTKPLKAPLAARGIFSGKPLQLHNQARHDGAQPVDTIRVGRAAVLTSRGRLGPGRAEAEAGGNTWNRQCHGGPSSTAGQQAKHHRRRAVPCPVEKRTGRREDGVKREGLANPPAATRAADTRSYKPSRS